MKLRSWTFLALFLLLLSAVTGCQPEADPTPVPAAPDSAAPPLPTVEQARTLIANDPQFGEFDFTWAAISLPLSVDRMHQEAGAHAESLRSAGWIQFEDGEIVLTEKALEDRRFIVRPNGFLEIVPLARKELLEIIEVRETEGENAVVELSWRWETNEIGQLLREGAAAQRFAATHRAKATLMPGAGGWQVLILERVEEPAPPV
ncbi:MAG TPA: hypothetical protein VM534_07580 [Thermoanaerobaculia bacterium]|nr:hypothetical protein [Thermoanaerobaculia bacterium]